MEEYKGILEIPTEEEIFNILNRKYELARHHKFMYRKLNDMVGYCNDKNTLINKFIDWANKYYDKSRLTSLMYLIYIRTSVNTECGATKHLLKFFNKSNYIYDRQIQDCDFYNRFDTSHEAIRWLIAYRGAKMYFLNGLKNVNKEE